MKRLMQRRGPDGSGTWCDPDGHLILGFQRLAIIDPSDKAMQPMALPMNNLCLSLMASFTISAS